MKKLFSWLKKNLIIFFSFFSFLGAQIVPGGEKPLNWCDFFKMLENIVLFLTFKIAVPLAALLLAVGGFLFLFSEGKPEKIGRAKTFFRAAIIGLILAFSATLLIDTLVSFLTGKGGLADLLKVKGIMECK
ncbi:hypothetical protein J7J37_00450 [bacterium]|nr:hypothetical protein [bacterium]